MEGPPTRYATTPDGVKVAYFSIGQGPVVVMLYPYHMNHLQLNWRVRLHRHAMEVLATENSLVALDFRGAGISQRNVPAISLELFADDIRTVLDD